MSKEHKFRGLTVAWDEALSLHLHKVQHQGAKTHPPVVDRASPLFGPSKSTQVHL